MTRRKRPQSGLPFSESLGKYNTFLTGWKLLFQCDLALHAATYHSGDTQGALWSRERRRLKERTQGTHCQHQYPLASISLQCGDLSLRSSASQETKQLRSSLKPKEWQTQERGLSGRITWLPSFWFQLVVYRITEVRGPVTAVNYCGK